MAQLLLVLAPLVALAALTLVGIGATVILGARFPRDAQAAAAPVVGAAIFACASQLVEAGVPMRPVTASLLAAGAVLAVIVRARARAALRAGVVPLAVALAALFVVSTPALLRGSWEVAAQANSDPYVRVSQARAILERPVPPPAAEHPDRVAFERIGEQGWAVGIAFGHASVAWVARADPALIQGILGAVLAALVPLAAFACARAVLEWSVRPAAAAGLALVLNAQVLGAAFVGWLPQLGATSFALLSAGALRLALEDGALRRERVLAALLAAASLAVYRLPFAPVLAGLLVAVLVGFAVSRRGRVLHTLRVAGTTAVAFVLLGLVSAIQLARGLSGFLSSQLAVREWYTVPHGELSHPLGLAARTMFYKLDAPGGLYPAALGLALLFLLVGATALRGRPRHDLLAAAAVFFVAGAVYLRVTGASGYLSYKLLGYGAPFLVLLAVLGIVAAGRRPLPAAAVAAAAAMVVLSAFATVQRAVQRQSTLGELAGLGAVLDGLPPGRVAVDVPDVWRQSWVIYSLRDRPASVELPSVYLTEMGLSRAPEQYRHRPFAYVVTESPAGDVLWTGSGLYLLRASSLPAGPMLTAWRSPRPATSGASRRSPRSPSATASATSSSATG